MWGRHVEHELHEATKKAKTEGQAQSRAIMVMKRLMDPPSEESETDDEDKTAPSPKPSAGKFRDPAARMTR